MRKKFTKQYHLQPLKETIRKVHRNEGTKMFSTGLFTVGKTMYVAL